MITLHIRPQSPEFFAGEDATLVFDFLSDTRAFPPDPAFSDAFVATITTPSGAKVRVAPGERPAPPLAKKAVRQFPLLAGEPRSCRLLLEDYADISAAGEYHVALNYSAEDVSLSQSSLTFRRSPPGAVGIDFVPRDYSRNGYFSALVVDQNTCLVAQCRPADHELRGFSRLTTFPADISDAALSIAPADHPTDWAWLCFLAHNSVYLVDASPLGDDEQRRVYPPEALPDYYQQTELVGVLSADDPDAERPPVTLALSSLDTRNNSRVLLLIEKTFDGPLVQHAPIVLPPGTVSLHAATSNVKRHFVAICQREKSTMGSGGIVVHCLDLPWGATANGFSLVDEIETDARWLASDVRLIGRQLHLGLLLEEATGWLRVTSSLDRNEQRPDGSHRQIVPLHPTPGARAFRVRLDAEGALMVVAKEGDHPVSSVSPQPSEDSRLRAGSAKYVVYGPFDVVARASAPAETAAVDILSRTGRPLMLIGYSRQGGPFLRRI